MNPPSSKYNLFWNNAADIQDVNIDYANTIFTDPMFNTDYNLDENSPAIDYGTASFEWQNKEVFVLSGDEYLGTAPDLGVFESK